MNVLLCYATNSGGTFLASEIIRNTLSEKNQSITVKRIDTVDPTEFSQYSLIIFGSPTWLYNKMDGMPHDLFAQFMETHQDLKLNGQSVAIYGLGDSSYTKFCGVVDHLEKYVAQIQGKLVVPSLRIDGFYFSEKNPQRVADWARQVITASAAKAGE